MWETNNPAFLSLFLGGGGWQKFPSDFAVRGQLSKGVDNIGEGGALLEA